MKKYLISLMNRGHYLNDLFKGMGGHHSSKMGKDEWLTPPGIIKSLGRFDLDPCSPINRPWDTAVNHYTIEDDGLSQEWEGRVWLNPPYGKYTGTWLHKLSEHGNGIALIFARTETEMFFDFIWNKAYAILFLLHRIKFLNVDGTVGKSGSGAPSCLIAYGEENLEALVNSKLEGSLILEWRLQ